MFQANQVIFASPQHCLVENWESSQGQWSAELSMTTALPWLPRHIIEPAILSRQIELYTERVLQGTICIHYSVCIPQYEPKLLIDWRWKEILLCACNVLSAHQCQSSLTLILFLQLTKWQLRLLIPVALCTCLKTRSRSKGRIISRKNIACTEGLRFDLQWGHNFQIFTNLFQIFTTLEIDWASLVCRATKFRIHMDRPPGLIVKYRRTTQQYWQPACSRKQLMESSLHGHTGQLCPFTISCRAEQRP